MPHIKLVSVFFSISQNAGQFLLMAIKVNNKSADRGLYVLLMSTFLTTHLNICTETDTYC